LPKYNNGFFNRSIFLTFFMTTLEAISYRDYFISFSPLCTFVLPFVSISGKKLLTTKDTKGNTKEHKGNR